MRLVPLKKRLQRDDFSPGRERTQQEDTQCAHWEGRSSHQEPALPGPYLDFTAFRTVRNKYLLFKPPSLWCVAIGLRQ